MGNLHRRGRLWPKLPLRRTLKTWCWRRSHRHKSTSTIRIPRPEEPQVIKSKETESTREFYQARASGQEDGKRRAVYYVCRFFLGWWKSISKMFLIALNSTLKKNIKMEGWVDGSEVKSIYCSYRRPKFNSWHPHDSSQLTVTPVSGGSDTLFCTLQTPDIHLTSVHTFRQNIHMYKIK